MDNAIKPITATTSLSLLMHGVAFAGLLLVYGQATTRDEGVGHGVEIQLISSALISDQQEVDVPRKQEAVADVSSKIMIREEQKKFAEDILTSLNSTRTTVVTEPDEKALFGRSRDELQHDFEPVQLSSDDNESAASIAQSTNASQQQHAILELLHARISNNKEYPYIARRQRREGVATIAFVLHPDGKIENAHLLNSSRTQALDRAALSAVKRIEPFTVAQDYLKQSEKFQVDVAFSLL